MMKKYFVAIMEKFKVSKHERIFNIMTGMLKTYRNLFIYPKPYWTFINLIVMFNKMYFKVIETTAMLVIFENSSHNWIICTIPENGFSHVGVFKKLQT